MPMPRLMRKMPMAQVGSTGKSRSTRTPTGRKSSTLILEIKGLEASHDRAKHSGAKRWVRTNGNMTIGSTGRQGQAQRCESLGLRREQLGPVRQLACSLADFTGASGCAVNSWAQSGSWAFHVCREPNGRTRSPLALALPVASQQATP